MHQGQLTRIRDKYEQLVKECGSEAVVTMAYTSGPKTLSQKTRELSKYRSLMESIKQ